MGRVIVRIVRNVEMTVSQLCNVQYVRYPGYRIVVELFLWCFVFGVF